jgi:hypothetical protein
MEPSLYETQCVQIIVKCLQKKDSSLSSKYCATAVRTFNENEHQEAFQQARLLLQESNWQSLNSGSLSFKSIEVDCLLHLLRTDDESDTTLHEPLTIVKVPRNNVINVDKKNSCVKKYRMPPLLMKCMNRIVTPYSRLSEPQTAKEQTCTIRTGSDCSSL